MSITHAQLSEKKDRNYRSFFVKAHIIALIDI